LFQSLLVASCSVVVVVVVVVVVASFLLQTLTVPQASATKKACV
jgi:hypothetical protein